MVSLDCNTRVPGTFALKLAYWHNTRSRDILTVIQLVALVAVLSAENFDVAEIEL